VLEERGKRRQFFLRGRGRVQVKGAAEVVLIDHDERVLLD
jgi:hypothetical protein